MTSQTWSNARSARLQLPVPSRREPKGRRIIRRRVHTGLLRVRLGAKASVSREARRLEGTEGREEASHARGARCGPRGQAATDELRSADGLLDQVEVRSLAVTSGRAMGCAFSLRGAGAFLTATESSAKRTESPL